MKFRLEIIRDVQQEETVIVRARKPSALTDAIERLVLTDIGENTLTVYSPQRDMTIELAYDQIESVSVVSGETVVTDRNGERYRSRLRLYELEEKLPSNFIRVNKSAIANRDAIERFAATFGGGVNVVYRSGATDYVSRRCFAEIKRRFNKP